MGSGLTKLILLVGNVPNYSKKIKKSIPFSYILYSLTIPYLFHISSIVLSFFPEMSVCYKKIADMSMKLTPSKRPHDQSLAETNGRRKWQKSSSFSSQRSPAKVRILCPASKIDFLIGEDNSIISRIQEETGAEVRVEDSIVGCDERVITIVGSGKEDEVGTKQVQDDVEGSETKGKDSCNDENGDKDENKVSLPAENSKTEKGTESIQKALFLVFDRMVEGGVQMDGGDEDGNNSSSLIIRLLVLSSQVGCLLGKGGSVIKQMSSESGSQIRILPRDKLPSCASSSDELVQVYFLIFIHSFRASISQLDSLSLAISCHQCDHLSVSVVFVILPVYLCVLARCFERSVA